MNLALFTCLVGLCVLWVGIRRARGAQHQTPETAELDRMLGALIRDISRPQSPAHGGVWVMPVPPVPSPPSRLPKHTPNTVLAATRPPIRRPDVDDDAITSISSTYRG